MRPSNRAPDEMRKVTFERGVARYAEGSCLVRFGETHVLCTASLEDKPPPWLRGQGRGWVTAEYAMLPRATIDAHPARIDHRQGLRPHAGNPAPHRPVAARRRRSAAPRRAPDHTRLRRHPGRRRHAHGVDHRRLGRAARLPEMDAQRSIMQATIPMRDHVAAVSCGIVKGEAVLDLDYAEDSTAETDANFVMTGVGRARRSAGHGGRRGVQRGATDEHAVAGARRHRAAGRLAEDDGGIGASERLDTLQHDVARRDRRIADRIGRLQGSRGRIRRTQCAGMHHAKRRGPARPDGRGGEVAEADGGVDLILRARAPAAERHHREADGAGIDGADEAVRSAMTGTVTGAAGRWCSGRARRSSGPPSAATMLGKCSAARPDWMAASISAQPSAIDSASPPSSSISPPSATTTSCSRGSRRRR